MKFRPCIDIHNGKVKQIVGGTLKDNENLVKENFVSEQDAKYYAKMYEKSGLTGGHIILLNKIGTKEYEEDVKQALKVLNNFNNKFQIGGGITDKNAKFFLDNGASHIIVTSYVFKDGKINFENLQKILDITSIGDKKRLVLDLSCRKKGDKYYIVTDRWQKFTDTVISDDTLDLLKNYCDEFLIHAVDVEGKSNGIEKDLVKILGDFGEIPITYAGGVGSLNDLEILRSLGKNKLDVTIGSALDLFGGNLKYEEIVEYMNK